MKKLLLVIDVQKDFINDITIEYTDKIEELINSNEYDDVAFTKFMNNKDSKWYRELKYNGCLDEVGQEIVIDAKKYKIFEKTIYSSVSEEFEEYLKENDITQIYLCGFDTDACVQKTALDLFEKDYDVYVLKDYCMSNAGIELHNVIIDNLKRLIGKDRII